MTSVRKEFLKRLEHLKDNRKDVIDGLTEICSLNSKYAKVITDTLFEEFKEAKPNRKIPLLFLMDSLLKKCKEQYQGFLEEGITEAFCEAYALTINKADIRRSLRILLKTWEAHFSGRTIMAIVHRIRIEQGEDINACLTIEDLDNLIEYYKRIGIDESHLVYQKKLLVDSKKPAKKEREKDREREREREREKDKDKDDGGGSLYVPEDIQKKFSQITTQKKTPKPVVAQPPQKPTSSHRPAKAEGNEYKIVKKPKVERDRPSADKMDPNTMMRKPDKSSTLMNIEGGSGPNFSRGGGGHGGPQSGSGSDRMNIPQSTFQQERPVTSSKHSPTSHQARSQQNYDNYQQVYEEQSAEAQFSDDESGSQQKKQFSHFNNNQAPHKFQTQPQHPHQQQHSHPPQSQNPPQSHYQHSQAPAHQGQPPIRRSEGHSQSKPQSQGTVQPQSQIPPQIQPLGQIPHSHPQNMQYPMNPPQQFPPIFVPGASQSSSLGPEGRHSFSHNQSQPQPQAQPQPQPYSKYPNHPFTNEAPSNQQQQRHPREILKDIQDVMARSKKGPEQTVKEPIETVTTPTLMSGRKDSFPDPTSIARLSENYDQTNVLVFKALLENLKREQPHALKRKYQQKMNKVENLSTIINRGDRRVVESLYDELPYRCSSCGIRFTNRSLLNKHLDWHFQFNMEMKEKQKTMNMRPQLITTEHWIRDEGNKNYKTALIDNAEDDFEFENYVPSSKDAMLCKGCGEAFKEVWDKDKEAWLLDGAAKVKYEEEETAGENGKSRNSSIDLMHFRCYKLCLQNETK